MSVGCWRSSFYEVRDDVRFFACLLADVNPRLTLSRHSRSIQHSSVLHFTRRPLRSIGRRMCQPDGPIDVTKKHLTLVCAIPHRGDGPFEFHYQIHYAKCWDFLLFSIIQSLCHNTLVSETTDRRQTTYHDDKRTLSCKLERPPKNRLSRILNDLIFWLYSKSRTTKNNWHNANALIDAWLLSVPQQVNHTFTGGRRLTSDYHILAVIQNRQLERWPFTSHHCHWPWRSYPLSLT